MHIHSNLSIMNAFLFRIPRLSKNTQRTLTLGGSSQAHNHGQNITNFSYNFTDFSQRVSRDWAFFTNDGLIIDKCHSVCTSRPRCSNWFRCSRLHSLQVMPAHQTEDQGHQCQLGYSNPEHRHSQELSPQGCLDNLGYERTRSGYCPIHSTTDVTG